MQSDEYLDALDDLWNLVGHDNAHPVYRKFLTFVDVAQPDVRPFVGCQCPECGAEFVASADRATPANP